MIIGSLSVAFSKDMQNLSRITAIMSNARNIIEKNSKKSRENSHFLIVNTKVLL